MNVMCGRVREQAGRPTAGTSKQEATGREVGERSPCNIHTANLAQGPFSWLQQHGESLAVGGTVEITGRI
ncbi:hypothetical protein DPEC_G00221410 [Dallia pectoralis]|uniref:Uncharacterized protein n=1 Tax=Dallia pectoralis TaxID=75939 RepID=A0ACC2G3U6_DALPE|nr:hypothetical protein DPEC_G00221410 [Dallia pectoralis]